MKITGFFFAIAKEADNWLTTAASICRNIYTKFYHQTKAKNSRWH